MKENIPQQPQIKTLTPKKLVGKSLKMSFANNRTAELWKSFSPRRNEMINNIGTALYSLQVYEPDHFLNFNPTKVFVKYALVEVSDLDNIPEGMEAFELEGGLYAVFTYKGLPSQASPFFQYIFGTWLPNSAYELDHRPHFEILGGKYSNTSPESEEEVWIPIKKK